MLMPLARVKFQIRDLVNEILDQLPDHVWTDPNTTFLDPAIGGGQFLIEIQRRLREAGHSDENIADRTWGCEIRNIRLLYAKNWHKVISNHLIKTDFVSYDWGDMKFDVIVGNPPYQNGNEKGGRSSLWRKFIAKSWPMVKPGGHMAMVVPQLPNSAQDLGHIFVEYQTKVVWTDIAKHFPGVGSSFYAWVVQNTPSTTSTLFIDEQEYVTITMDRLPKDIKAIGLVTKFKEWPTKIPVKSSSQYHAGSVADGKDEHKLSSKKSKKLCYKYRRTNGDTFDMWGADEPDDYYATKVSMTYSGYPGFTYHSKNDPIGTVRDMSGHVLVKNKQEAQSLISLLESKTYTYVRDQISKGGMRGQKIYEQPLLSLDRIWTDDQIYKEIDLSLDEIKLIESSRA